MEQRPIIRAPVDQVVRLERPHAKSGEYHREVYGDVGIKQHGQSPGFGSRDKKVPANTMPLRRLRLGARHERRGICGIDATKRNQREPDQRTDAQRDKYPFKKLARALLERLAMGNEEYRVVAGYACLRQRFGEIATLRVYRRAFIISIVGPVFCIEILLAALGKLLEFRVLVRH